MAQTFKIPVARSITYNGTTYRLAPATVGDLEELGQYLRDQYIDEAKRYMFGLPEAVYKDAWRHAKDKADKIKPVTKAYINASQSLKGLAYAMFLQLQKHHADVTLELATEILQSDFNNFGDKVNDALGLETVEENPKEPQAANG